jgi:hypothetical protein
MVVGLSFGIMFFNRRAHYVHRLHLAPPSGSVKGRNLLFQTCGNGRLQGHVVPLSHCKIMLGAKDWTLVSLEAKGTEGVFRIGTTGAKIDGKDVPPSKVFHELSKRGIPSERLDTRKSRKK